MGQQIVFQENIQEYLIKAEALANVALSDDFLDYKQSTIHSYLWTLSDMIVEVKILHEKALNDLLKQDY